MEKNSSIGAEIEQVNQRSVGLNLPTEVLSCESGRD